MWINLQLLLVLDHCLLVCPYLCGNYIIRFCNIQVFKLKLNTVPTLANVEDSEINLSFFGSASPDNYIILAIYLPWVAATAMHIQKFLVRHDTQSKIIIIPQLPAGKKR